MIFYLIAYIAVYIQGTNAMILLLFDAIIASSKYYV